ncbi:MAG: carbon monoxide dehydrogenase [Eubacterium aggregans]|uniref:Carbon-monoxide dehydrogenase catalytic subunit n=1 Tax=Eubacterium aggregans TaxID=81409 RepID=A0A1H4C770_9FIRM|nr:carbon monoxide dehydrogenase [Eubacterium aggregans]MEA5073802.1 carbon monoxide dehydrogenase [Eubacterium aggregans]SEA56285.1 carbon-monoxide dehydrogenase catalytic subunit [Eubacterium aggregans]
MKETHNDHHEHHGHDHEHQHRSKIQFDRNGIPKVLSPKESVHSEDYPDDYSKAVNTYRKTFPNKQRVLAETPDPGVKEMMERMAYLNIDTAFDRFDAQQPQCIFGLGGTCCKNCNMGPCRITKKSPRGVCGADADLIVARNLLRSAAAGAAQHGMHAREVILMLKWAAQGKMDIAIDGEHKIRTMAKAFGIQTAHRQLKHITIDLADRLLKDLSQTEPDDYATISACAPKERQQIWKEMDILPISAYHEVFEAYHKSGCAIDSDWESIMRQFLRCGLVFTFSGVLGAAIATDALLGIGDRATAKTNIGALKEGYVNIAVHGHLPVLVREIVKTGYSEKYQKLAREKGAKGIQFYGICCSSLAAMYRYSGVIPLSNAISAELVLGTGALDLWVADVQEIYPAIMDVARCYQTTVVTTSDSNRLPGAEHIGYDHHHSNIDETGQIAERIVERAIESFEKRRHIPVFIPPYEIEAEVGFSVEYIQKIHGGLEKMAEALRSGEILGIVNLVGCNNPKVVYEKAIVDVAEVLLKHNVLIITNGCASFPLMKLGFCQTTELAYGRVGASLRAFLEPDNLPPVWHVGECIDNARSSAFFAGIAGEFDRAIHEMPYAFTSPEWSNEKGLDASLGFRLMGVNTYHCVEAPIHGSEKVIRFLKEDTRSTLGAVMVVDADPVALGEKMVADLQSKRKALGW